MPHVEVLPSSTSVRAPGYALVPDAGSGTFQAPAQQTSGKKRAARSLGLAGGDTTVRQQNAILKHLAELDKDSHRDVQIPVPKDNAGRGEALRDSRHLGLEVSDFGRSFEKDYPKCSTHTHVTKDLREPPC